ncbi:hypothetical protein Dimus_036224 [Dionaea muscipula]
MPGRPSLKKRRLEEGEKIKQNKVAIKGQVQHCINCGQNSHNKRTCPAPPRPVHMRRKLPVQRRETEETYNPTSAYPLGMDSLPTTTSYQASGYASGTSQPLTSANSTEVRTMFHAPPIPRNNPTCHRESHVSRINATTNQICNVGSNASMESMRQWGMGVYNGIAGTHYRQQIYQQRQPFTLPNRTLPTNARSESSVVFGVSVIGYWLFQVFSASNLTLRKFIMNVDGGVLEIMFVPKLRVWWCN